MSEQNLPATQDEAEGETQVALPSRPKPTLVGGGRIQAIIPHDIDQAYRLATMIAAADMAPKAYKRDANAIMVGMLHGMEVGFTPMAALQSIAVVNGMPTIWGDGALGLIQASGLLEDKKEWIDTDDAGGWVAHCELKRKGQPSWNKQTFSWEDAKVAKLLGKDTYQLHGKRMLQRRARARAMADGFADVLRGLHIREEVDMGNLEQNDDGSYSTAPAAAEPTRAPLTPPRPTREQTKQYAEDEKKRRDKFRETMQDDLEKARKDKPTHDAQTGEIQQDEKPKPQPAAKPAAKAAAKAASAPAPAPEPEPEQDPEPEVEQEGDAPDNGEAEPETTKVSQAEYAVNLEKEMTDKIKGFGFEAHINAFAHDYSQDLEWLKDYSAEAHKRVTDAVNAKRDAIRNRGRGGRR